MLSKPLIGQHVHIPAIDSSFSRYYYNFKAENAYSKHEFGDTVRMKIKLPKVDFQMALFSGNAEINRLICKDTILYSGKYVDRNKAYAYEDVCFFVLPKDLQDEYVELESYNLSHHDFYISPIIIKRQHLDFHIVKLYEESQISILTMIGFIGGCFLVLIFFIAMYFINERKYNDYLYFCLYILFVIIHNSIQSDSYLRTYYLFPSNPILYHKLFESHIILNYLVFLLFIRKFLQMDKLYPKVAHVMNWVMGIFMVIFLIFFSTSILTNNLAIIQNKLFFLFIVCIALGAYLIHVINSNIKNGYLVYTTIGSTILVLSSTIEFIFARIFSDAYHWNLQYPMIGGISPSNFTQYGNWINIMFFAMMIGYKYKITEKKLFTFRLTKLSELEKKTTFKEYKIKELEQIQSFQSEQLFEKNKVFGSLRSQMGTVIQKFNPEFFENMVEAIAFNIDIGKKEEAKDQISLLKEFISRILKYSHRGLIPMNEDVRNIEIFVQLDRYRLQSLFDYSLSISPKIKNPNLVCPSFFYQEYLEIVMWNHFDKNATNNQLDIAIRLQDKNVVVEIIESSELILKINKEEILQALDNIQARILNFVSLDDYSMNYEIQEDRKTAILILNVRTDIQLRNHLN